MAQINCPKCGYTDAREYFYYISCEKCGYEEEFEEELNKDEDEDYF